MLTEQLTQVSPDALSYETEIDRPLHYYRHWQSLVFILRNAKCSKSAHLYDVDVFSSLFDETDDQAIQSDETSKEADVDGSKDQKHLKHVGLSTKSTTRHISAKAFLQKDAIWGVSLAGEGDEEQRQIRYEVCRLDIFEHNENHIGSFWTNDDRTIAEEGLHCEIRVNNERMNSIFPLARDLADGDELVVRGYGLLFENQVDASLKEHYHPSTYVVIGTAKFALETIVVRPIDTSSEAYLDERYEAEEAAENIESNRAKARATPTTKPQESENVRKLTHAVWALASAIVFLGLAQL